MNKISIIGTGSVGSTIAYTLTTMGIASEIVMIDINKDKAFGEALDIRQGTPFLGACSIYSGDYSDAKDSNIVILTSGIARKPVSPLFWPTSAGCSSIIRTSPP